jgi:hypothetical protein
LTTTLDRVTQLNAGNVRAPLGGYVLGRGMAVYGKGGKGQTVVRRRDKGSVVTSLNLAKWKASGGGQWAHEGVPTGPTIGGFTVDGEDKVNPNPNLETRESGKPAIEFYAPGATVNDVKVFDLAGIGLVVGHGSANMDGWSDVTENQVIRIQEFRTDRTHSGLLVTSTADGIADDLEFHDGRGFGACFNGAAWTISRLHAAGFIAQATEDEPDRGCGIVNGEFANYYGAGIQPDNCRVGFRNYGEGATVKELIGKLCSEITVHAVRRMTVESLRLETLGGFRTMKHFNPRAIGCLVEGSAAGSIIGNKFSEWTTGHATEATCCKVEASRCQIRNSCGSWGGMHKGNTVVEFGSPKEKLWGCVIEVWASGFGCGVRLTHPIGRGNTFIVHHNGNCLSPIDLGPNSDLAGNTIVIDDATGGGK